MQRVCRLSHLQQRLRYRLVMNEEWRILGNLACLGFSLAGLFSGVMAFSAASRWLTQSHSGWAKLACFTLIGSSVSSLVHVWVSYLWRIDGVVFFSQWEDKGMAYLASGASVIVSSFIFICFHVLCHHFIGKELAKYKRVNHAWTR